MNLYKNQALLNYFLLKLTNNILMSWAILISIISILDLSDLYNKTRFIESIAFNDIFFLTIENIPIRADDLLFYAILFGTVMCFLELKKSQEFLILRVNGISVWKSFVIISIVPLLFGIFSIFILNPIVSFSQKIYSIHHDRLFEKGVYSISISNEGLWLRDRSNQDDILIKGSYLDTEKSMIKNPVFFLISSNTLPAKRIDADWAFLDNYKWILENTKVNGKNFNAAKTINIKSVLTKDDLKFTSNSPHSLSLFEIPRFIKILESTGIPSSVYKVYFHKILSQPLSYIGIIALAGALIFGKFSRLPSNRTLTFTIIGGFVYFFVQKLFIALGSSGQMPIILATWIPSVLLLGLGVLLIVLIEES